MRREAVCFSPFVSELNPTGRCFACVTPRRDTGDNMLEHPVIVVGYFHTIQRSRSTLPGPSPYPGAFELLDTGAMDTFPMALSAMDPRTNGATSSTLTTITK